MLKTNNIIALFTVTFIATSPLLLTACSSGTGAAASGADSKRINATRGNKNAHMTSAQEEQYARQQRVSAREVKLENMKRRQATDAVIEGADAVRAGSDAVKGASSAVQDLKNLFK